jgi:hypothetical protein
MKRLSLILIAGLFVLCACKKEQAIRTIDIQITNIATTGTTYNLNVTNANGSSPHVQVDNGATNQNLTFTCPAGATLTVTYNFTTQGQQYGQGNIEFIYQSQSLLKIDGGFGTQTIHVP